MNSRKILIALLILFPLALQGCRGSTLPGESKGAVPANAAASSEAGIDHKPLEDKANARPGSVQTDVSTKESQMEIDLGDGN